MNNIDLHIHSSYSDGTLTPKEIVNKAVKLGVKTISITDHDTIMGTKEGRILAKEAGLQYVNGVELSTFSCTEIHILGYKYDVNNQKLIDALEDFSQKREERVNRIIKELERFKVYIKREDLDETGSIGRLHVAKALVSKGYVASIPEAFDRYLGARGVAYFPSMRITPIEGIKLIREAGGIPVIAHPLRFFQNKQLEDLIKGLIPFGLGGIEAYYNTHDEKTSEMFVNLAKKYGLIATGGTDFHGANRNIELGSVQFNLDGFTKNKLGLK